MSKPSAEAPVDELTVEQWLEVRVEAGKTIDPETALVTKHYVQMVDPYGVVPDLPDEMNCLGVQSFARSPGSDIWVWFGDLPDETHARLSERISSQESSSTMHTEATVNQLPVEQWLELRREAAKTIDPETAEVVWKFAQTLDPYGVDPDLPAECYQVGREYFARSPGSDIWVWFGELPYETTRRLHERHEAYLNHPKDLIFVDD